MIQNYIDKIKVQLAISPYITSVEIIKERNSEDRGYFHARMKLSSGDFLEVSEYFVMQGAQPSTQEYRYQWMDGAQKELIKRWDNARHHSNLFNFPHHIHIENDEQVISGQSLSIIDVLNIIELEIK